MSYTIDFTKLDKPVRRVMVDEFISNYKIKLNPIDKMQLEGWVNTPDENLCLSVYAERLTPNQVFFIWQNSEEVTKNKTYYSRIFVCRQNAITKVLNGRSWYILRVFRKYHLDKIKQWGI